MVVTEFRRHAHLRLLRLRAFGCLMTQTEMSVSSFCSFLFFFFFEISSDSLLGGSSRLSCPELRFVSTQEPRKSRIDLADERKTDRLFVQQFFFNSAIQPFRLHTSLLLPLHNVNPAGSSARFTVVICQAYHIVTAGSSLLEPSQSTC